MGLLDTCPICGEQLMKTGKYDDKCLDANCLYNDEKYMSKWSLLEFMDDDSWEYGNR